VEPHDAQADRALTHGPCGIGFKRVFDPSGGIRKVKSPVLKYGQRRVFNSLSGVAICIGSAIEDEFTRICESLAGPLR
jgi:hypothetical protein